MKIGVLSDTHGAQATLTHALELLREQGVSTVLHCGDIDDVETLLLLRGWAAHVVFGNCDIDREVLRRAAAEIGATIHEPFGHLEIAGRQIAFLHGDDGELLHDLIQAAHYDFIFHGHTHQAADHWEGTTRVINPGALFRAKPRSCIALDLTTGKVATLIAG
jgi:uncharacterized protein